MALPEFLHMLRGRDKAMAWNGFGAAFLVGSLMVNLISIPMNVYNHEQLVALSPGAGLDYREPVSDIVMGLDSMLMSSAPFHGADGSHTDTPSRHLASANAGSSAGSSSGSTSGSGHGSSHGGHHAHPHVALIFMFVAFVIGAAVMQISARWPILQQTVLLFVLGFVLSLILKGADVTGNCAAESQLNPSTVCATFASSYTMWMGIDPHLLLFTLLPALLAGDAMTIDTSVAKRVGLQCLFLAGPGVIIGGFGTAAFMQLLNPDWDFVLCVCAGAILCATDPVAVVALLKELGASPIITVQIQGESLLNDGTAIVLYLVSYDILCGEEYDAADIAEFLIKKAMMAWAIGLFIGYFFFSWIRAASDKLDHASGMIQITLTLCAAYWSFIFVEGVLQLSGVLATVACSLVLAHHMWPYVVAEDSMNHCWHTFESLGNMIVFFLAGAKTGEIFVDVEPIDILHLFAIWVFLLVLRAALMFSSRPVLQRLSADRMPVSWQDATLMTWGGLRGAVGLALALAVNNDLAPDIRTGKPNIPAKEGERILFFVAGIAFMTTLVNATTAPALVKKLGITALPQARLTLLKMFHSQLVGWAEGSNHPPEVVVALKHMLHEAEHHIDHQQVSTTGPSSTRSSGDLSAKVAPEDKAHGQADAHCQQNPALIKELAEAAEAYDKVPKDEIHRGLIGEELDDNLLGKVDDMIALISNQYVDEGMAKVVNEIFLTLVFNNYWKLIDEGLVRPGSVELEVLLTAVRISLSPFRADLVDFYFVQQQMDTHPDFKDTGEMGGMADPDLAKAGKEPGPLHHLVASWQFNVSVGVAILFNTLQVVAEEIWRDPCKPDINDHKVWLVLDAFFTVFFLAEFFLKFCVLKCSYFGSAWNKFDFLLVWVGVFGLVMSLATMGKGAEMAGKTRIIRVARVLRTLRFLRIFRLFHAKMSGDKFVSMDLAREFKKVTVLTCFVRAHVLAQLDLVKYFGGNGKLDEANESEIARCILQSQVAVYKALCVISSVQEEMGEGIYRELENLYRRKHITEGLSKWVLKAHKDGALSATEAHAILHPLNHMVAECVQLLSERAEGFMEADGHRPSIEGKAEFEAAMEGAEEQVEEAEAREEAQEEAEKEAREEARKAKEEAKDFKEEAKSDSPPPQDSPPPPPPPVA